MPLLPTSSPHPQSGPEKPGVIVLDCMLPGTDGFAITRALREAQRFTPILMLTARAHPDDILEGIEAGADDYLPKPFDLNILIVRIKSLLRRTAWQAAQAPHPDPALSTRSAAEGSASPPPTPTPSTTAPSTSTPWS